MPSDLSPKLAKIRDEIIGYASGYGLDFFETIFEVCNYEEINMVPSYGGFPTRYPHWRFGMEYERLKKSYAYGLSKIYELVINNDPCYAYLLESNNLIDQKLVMAHVYGHCDFFKNNFYFSQTNRKMLDEMANHATRVRKYIDKYGIQEVERFLDAALTIEDLIDPYSVFIGKNNMKEEELITEDDQIVRFKVNKSYMDSYINPDNFIEEQREKIKEKKALEDAKFPPHPERDILLFLIHHAPLKNWQKDILNIVREEAYYFYPQGQTKIMNEGWASYWHSTILTQKALDSSEIIDFADIHSGVMSGGNTLNPYKIGIELYRDIEDRWNKGRFGKEYEECDDLVERAHWNKDLGLGREKIFEVRKLHNDISFIDEFLTPEFCAANRLFTFKYNPKAKEYQIASREFQKIKQQILRQLTNRGMPTIHIENANHKNRGEMLLYHNHFNDDLDMNYARETLKNLHILWTRPVLIETKKEGKSFHLLFDGTDFTELS